MIVWYKHTPVNLYYIYVLMAFPTEIEQCSGKNTEPSADNSAKQKRKQKQF